MVTIKALLSISFGFIIIGSLGSLLMYGLEEGHDLVPAIIISLTFVIFAFVAYELFKMGIKSLKEEKQKNL